jgi:hypothetical protein
MSNPHYDGNHHFHVKLLCSIQYDSIEEFKELFQYLYNINNMIREYGLYWDVKFNFKQGTQKFFGVNAFTYYGYNLIDIVKKKKLIRFVKFK